MDYDVFIDKQTTNNYRILNRAHTSAITYWNRHSVITGNQQVHQPKFPSLCCNWFSQLHFHFHCLHQSTTRLYKYNRITGICSALLPIIPQLFYGLWKSTRNFSGFLANRQTNGEWKQYHAKGMLEVSTVWIVHVRVCMSVLYVKCNYQRWHWWNNPQ